MSYIDIESPTVMWEYLVQTFAKIVLLNFSILGQSDRWKIIFVLVIIYINSVFITPAIYSFFLCKSVMVISFYYLLSVFFPQFCPSNLASEFWDKAWKAFSTLEINIKILPYFNLYFMLFLMINFFFWTLSYSCNRLPRWLPSCPNTNCWVIFLH